MTQKQARKTEQILKSRGVYKPYVSMDGAVLFVESYPLTAVVTSGAVDPEMGPFQCVKITDCSLPRIGQDAVVSTDRVFLGQDLLGRVAALLASFHTAAHSRAEQQDYDSIRRNS